MKTVTFLIAIILMSACSSTSTTMQQQYVVTKIKLTKKGIRIKSKPVSKPVPIANNKFIVGDTITVFGQQR